MRTLQRRSGKTRERRVLHIDPSHPLANGLVFFAPLNEGSGRYANDVVNRWVGKLRQEENDDVVNLTDMPHDSQWGAGFRGGWAWKGLGDTATGFGQSVRFAHHPKLNLTNLSISIWVNMTQTGNSTYRTPIAKRIAAAGAGSTNYELFFNNNAGADAGQLSYYDGNALYASAHVPPVRRWTQIGCTVRGLTLTLYNDGRPVYATTLSAVPSANVGSLVIGRGGEYLIGETVLGMCADASIWNYDIGEAGMKQVHADSWCFIAPPGARRQFVPPYVAPAPPPSDFVVHRRLPSPSDGTIWRLVNSTTDPALQ